VQDGTDHYPLVEKALEKGLTVDNELKFTSRKTSAFADDTNCGLLRDAANLRRVKIILSEFGTISGLETNVEKTTLMPIGNRDEVLDPEVMDLGFQVVNEMKCLGIMLNDSCTNLSDHFDITIVKIRNLIRLWGRYNLSLPGKINISKTMLISQIGYAAAIITPTRQQVDIMQNLVDGYVTAGTVVAKDRLYKDPKMGGLGLIDLNAYIPALQCSWLRRCTFIINDSWRRTLALSCNFYLVFVSIKNIDKNLHPVLYDIVESVSKLQCNFWAMNENFLMAPLIDNPFFMRAEPGRRAPVIGCVDRNLIGGHFYDTHKERLLSLRLNCLIRPGNRLASLPEINRTTGLVFTYNVYMHLLVAARFAIKKYGNKPVTNGTTLPLAALFIGNKKGSRRYRKIIEKSNGSIDLQRLRVVKTFF